MVAYATQVQTGRALYLGRARPLPGTLPVALSSYRDRGEIKLPESVDYAPKALPILHDMLANDRMGCCTISGMFHVIGTLLVNAGVPLPPNLNAAGTVALYKYLTGGADTGLDEIKVLNYWRDYGITAPSAIERILRLFRKPKIAPDHRITGYVLLDGSKLECRRSLYLFENLYFGVELPDAWLKPAPAGDGFVWDVAGDPEPKNGHCFIGVGYTPTGIKIDTWGMLGTITDAAIERYAVKSTGGMLYSVLSDDIIDRATQKAPNGYAWNELVADLGGA